LCCNLRRFVLQPPAFRHRGPGRDRRGTGGRIGYGYLTFEGAPWPPDSMSATGRFYAPNPGFFFNGGLFRRQMARRDLARQRGRLIFDRPQAIAAQ
jgi:hypothetical protein